MKTNSSAAKTFLLTGVTLIAFAANSLLTRMALGEGTIDAASFVTIRLASGALMLAAITGFTSPQKPGVSRKGRFKTGFLKRGDSKTTSWAAALMLFLYAIAFSFSYLQLATGTGALILFGTVQITMIVTALKQGEKPTATEWVGLGLALLGLIYLVSPGLAAPPVKGSVLMVIAGIAWGGYSLLGRGNTQPVMNTMNNFVRAVPFAIGASLVSISQLQLSAEGIWLAVLSGAIASGIGYALWYAALRELTATRAATVQLSVPVLAAIGGILFLQEALSLRLFIASLMILGGVGLTLKGKQQG